jgi:hypothetical protein
MISCSSGEVIREWNAKFSLPFDAPVRALERKHVDGNGMAVAARDHGETQASRRALC